MGCDEEDIFKKHRETIIEKMRKYANATYSAMENSYSRIVIGKLWWKTLVLPAVLLGAGIINFTDEEINEIQIIENNIYRKMLKTNKYTPTSALRGEVGALKAKNRIIETNLLIIKSILNGKNSLMKKILTNILNEKENSMNKQINKGLKLTNMNINQLNEIEKNKLREKIRKIDTNEWIEDMEKCKTLDIYRKNKKKFGDEKIYENNEMSTLFMKVRTNSLEVNGRVSFLNDNKSKICKLCNKENETITHFILECEKLSQKRNNELIKKYKKESTEKTFIQLMYEFKKNDLYEIKIMIYALWKERNRLMEIT